MNTPPIKYPLDLTGTSTDNLVTGEEHSLASAPNRAFVPSNGPFFTKSLVVRSMTDGKVLKADYQYKAVQLFVDATLRTGQEICSVIVITDDTVGDTFSIDYQVLGGEFSSSTYAIEQMIDALKIDNRAVKWGEIIGKPEEFAPAPHLHDLGDLYGFEYLTGALEEVRRAILQGDDASHDVIYKYINSELAKKITPAAVADMITNAWNSNIQFGDGWIRLPGNICVQYGTETSVLGSKGSQFIPFKKAYTSAPTVLVSPGVNIKYTGEKIFYGKGDVSNDGFVVMADGFTPINHSWIAIGSSDGADADPHGQHLTSVQTSTSIPYQVPIQPVPQTVTYTTSWTTSRLTQATSAHQVSTNVNVTRTTSWIVTVPVQYMTSTQAPSEFQKLTSVQTSRSTSVPYTYTTSWNSSKTTSKTTTKSTSVSTAYTATVSTSAAASRNTTTSWTTSVPVYGNTSKTTTYVTSWTTLMCVVAGTPIDLADGTQVLVDDLTDRAQLASLKLPDLHAETVEDYHEYRTRQLANAETVTTNVTHIEKAVAKQLIRVDFEGCDKPLEVTPSHPFLIEDTDGSHCFIEAVNLTTNDRLIDRDLKPRNVRDVTKREGEFTIYKVCCDPYDLFIHDGIVGHNLKYNGPDKPSGMFPTTVSRSTSKTTTWSTLKRHSNRTTSRSTTTHWTTHFNTTVNTSKVTTFNTSYTTTYTVSVPKSKQTSANTNTLTLYMTSWYTYMPTVAETMWLTTRDSLVNTSRTTNYVSSRITSVTSSWMTNVTTSKQTTRMSTPATSYRTTYRLTNVNTSIMTSNMGQL